MRRRYRTLYRARKKARDDLNLIKAEDVPDDVTVIDVHISRDPVPDGARHILVDEANIDWMQKLRKKRRSKRRSS